MVIGEVLVVLAHGSGIDDILWFAVPVAIAIVAIRMAEKRAQAKARAHAEEETPPT